MSHCHKRHLGSLLSWTQPFLSPQLSLLPSSFALETDWDISMVPQFFDSTEGHSSVLPRSGSGLFPGSAEKEGKEEGRWKGL